MATMKAVVIHEAGGPEVLKVQQWTKPVPVAGQVLIRVKAFGLNRSEMFTRQGHSGADVKFPRVLGIEAVGEVEEAPGGEFNKGDVVGTCMGGMGRNFDGGYAEYTCVPSNQVQVVKTKLSWEQLGALPEMMQTVWGSLFESLQLQKSDTLLIRGGTTSIGLAATALAKDMCASVAVTTRKPEREAMLKENGAKEVFIDGGSIAEEVRKRYLEGVSKVLELVGVVTLEDSLKCVKAHGVVCVTGIVGGKWIFENFNPHIIPTSVYLTTYAGFGSHRFKAIPLDRIAQRVVDGTLKIPIKTFTMDQIVDAHRAMDENTAGGKIVVVVD
ncbi:related to NADPH:quinone reductase and related Zn-dependent oxidoreductases [Phialocephala subalpina]|uniref:Related to NADPH:quinone reductase and related Zn-dependent oxidoreductases n=1 Tax=Phialocephala subalpina TaxID=576137 RepID=A0A1L7WWJ8_9HELO|nr:related to NADPH:quinone reductase and related Zn-dependent oxidoreductases [Phialocephala subalpina]